MASSRPATQQNRPTAKASALLALLAALLIAAGCARPASGAAGAEAPPAPVEPAAESASVPADPAPERIPVNEPARAATPTPAPTASPAPTALPFGETTAATEYILPLTVQHVTGSTAVLTFELQEPADGLLLYWPVEDRADQHVVELAPGEAGQQIVLSGLEPGTGYEAVVGLGPDSASGVFRQPPFLKQRWGPITFTTAGAQGDEPLRVGVIGDSGFGEERTYQLAAGMAAADLDFALHTGDVVYQMYNDANPFESYAFKWYLPFQPVLAQMPVYPVVGNHDVEAAASWQDAPFYYHAFPPFPDPRFEPSAYAGRNMWYAVAYGDVQFLMLDTQVFFNEGGRVEQELWIAERLADERFAITIPVMHVPPYNFGQHAGTGATVRAWVPLFKQGNVPLVLAGHDHNYQRFAVDELTYIISGGGSTVLYPQAETPLPDGGVFVRQSHWVQLEIYPDRIDVTAYGVDGAVLDEATVPLD